MTKALYNSHQAAVASQDCHTIGGHMTYALPSYVYIAMVTVNYYHGNGKGRAPGVMI